MIAEKTIPKSVTILKRTSILLVLILCGLSVFDLGMKITNENEIKVSMNAMNSGYLLSFYLSKVNYYTDFLI